MPVAAPFSVVLTRLCCSNHVALVLYSPSLIKYQCYKQERLKRQNKITFLMSSLFPVNLYCQLYYHKIFVLSFIHKAFNILLLLINEFKVAGEFINENIYINTHQTVEFEDDF